MDSVSSQTFGDLEIICVDDGSTDKCPEILDEYAKRDSRFKIVHKKNEGYGKTMNVGLDMAKGKYIGIVESDDWIEPEMYEQLYNVAENNGVDYVKADFKMVWPERNFCYRYPCLNNSDDYYRILTHDDLNIVFNAAAIWTGLYRRDFLCKNNIRFNETSGASYQDQGFWVQTGFLYERAMYLNNAFYNYRQDNPASSVKSREKMLAMLYEYDFIEKRMGNIKSDKKLYGFYTYLRFRGHIETLGRIENKLKHDFCQYIIDDYLPRKKYVDISSAHDFPDIVGKLEKINNNAEEYCNTLISNNENAIRTIKNLPLFIIYGLGIWARNLIIKLYNYDLLDHVLGFAVTNKENADIFFDIPVYNISELTDKKEMPVIIAVKSNSKAYNEIVQTLNEIGFVNYIDSIDVLKYL